MTNADLSLLPIVTESQFEFYSETLSFLERIVCDKPEQSISLMEVKLKDYLINLYCIDVPCRSLCQLIVGRIEEWLIEKSPSPRDEEETIYPSFELIESLEQQCSSTLLMALLLGDSNYVAQTETYFKLTPTGCKQTLFHSYAQKYHAVCSAEIFVHNKQIELAARAGKLKLVKTLVAERYEAKWPIPLVRKQINLYVMLSLYKGSHRGGYLDVIRYCQKLMQEKEIADDLKISTDLSATKLKSLARTVKSGNTEAIDFILKSEVHGPNSLCLAIAGAAKTGNMEVLNSMFDRFKQFQPDRDPYKILHQPIFGGMSAKILASAIKRGQPSIMNRVLEIHGVVHMKPAQYATFMINKMRGAMNTGNFRLMLECKEEIISAAGMINGVTTEPDYRTFFQDRTNVITRLNRKDLFLYLYHHKRPNKHQTQHLNTALAYGHYDLSCYLRQENYHYTIEILYAVLARCGRREIFDLVSGW